ncbi:hypothetical protein [Allomuricauda sp. M10]|nr:hypothetical protein [Muricauda sp. M10]
MTTSKQYYIAIAILFLGVYVNHWFFTVPFVLIGLGWFISVVRVLFKK